MADALLAATADAGAANEFGATPLWLAAQNGSATMVKRLLEAGADPNAVLASGETVLMMAARTGSSEAVRLLVEHGAEIDATEHTRGQTAMMWAIAERQSDVVKTLLELGADITVRSAERPRRIHTRTAGFNPSGVVDVTQGGNCALLFAARHGVLDAARYLVAAGKGYYGGYDLMNIGTHVINSIFEIAGCCIRVSLAAMIGGQRPVTANVGSSPNGMGTIIGENITSILEFGSGLTATMTNRRRAGGNAGTTGFIIQGIGGELALRTRSSHIR